MVSVDSNIMQIWNIAIWAHDNSGTKIETLPIRLQNTKHIGRTQNTFLNGSLSTQNGYEVNWVDSPSYFNYQTMNVELENRAHWERPSYV